jgi:purine catabolism regulator
MVVRLGESPGADQVVIAQRRVRTLDAIMHTVRAAGHTALAATRDDGQIDIVLAPQRTGTLEQVCTVIRDAVIRLDGVSRCIIGVGPESSRLVDAVGGLREAAHVAEVAMSMPVQDKAFHRVADVRLRGLLSLIRTDPRVQAFAETELAGLLAHRAKHGDEAFDLLRHFLQAGGNKAELARMLHMSRPTLYARLDALQRIVGLDLDAAESRTSLHVAMLILSAAGE